ncbi:MAG TPA: NAD(P)-binding domain-containing protein, partial [Kouleothrix sp.]|nr:NAD(P)-binding domain-containing protein [Kouleothrix sp.]
MYNEATAFALKGEEKRMQLGMIGLGRMGLNMARRLIGGGHTVVGYDRAPAQVETLRAAGGAG